jgi:hypothetical protein
LLLIMKLISVTDSYVVPLETLGFVIYSLLMSKERHFVAYWLRHYATSRKIAGSRPDEVHFFSIYLIFPAALGPGVYSASNRNDYQKQKNKVSGE